MISSQIFDFAHILIIFFYVFITIIFKMEEKMNITIEDILSSDYLDFSSLKENQHTESLEAEIKILHEKIRSMENKINIFSSYLLKDERIEENK
jgi:hypothetical protein